jgi:hypothetical protein
MKTFSSESFHRGQEVMQDSSFKFLCTDSTKIFSRELPRKVFFSESNQTRSPSKTSFKQTKHRDNNEEKNSPKQRTGQPESLPQWRVPN